MPTCKHCDKKKDEINEDGYCSDCSPVWHNCYTCPKCGHVWEDDWDCQVDDDCPECGERHISTNDSEMNPPEHWK